MGDLQLWSLQEMKLVDSMPCADPVTAVTQVPGSPYLCLGCESGALQFVQLTTQGGSPAEGVCEARALDLLPYERAQLNSMQCRVQENKSAPKDRKTFVKQDDPHVHEQLYCPKRS